MRKTQGNMSDLMVISLESKRKHKPVMYFILLLIELFLQ